MTMTLSKLVNMDMGTAVEWLTANHSRYALLPENELESLVSDRDNWEEKATELANDVAAVLGVDVGEHTSANCPVQNAIDAVYQAKQSQ